MIVLVLSMLVVAMAAASVGAVSAGTSSVSSAPTLKHLKPGTGGYVVTFGKSSSSSASAQSMSAMAVVLQNVIFSGQNEWAQKVVYGNPLTIYTDVSWDNSANSISVTVYTPDGYVLGPVYDNIDGRTNGDIPLSISKSGGVSPGSYYYQMYGYRISGAQYYTFS